MNDGITLTVSRKHILCGNSLPRSCPIAKALNDELVLMMKDGDAPSCMAAGPHKRLMTVSDHLVEVYAAKAHVALLHPDHGWFIYSSSLPLRGSKFVVDFDKSYSALTRLRRDGNDIEGDDLESYWDNRPNGVEPLEFKTEWHRDHLSMTPDYIYWKVLGSKEPIAGIENSE